MRTQKIFRASVIAVLIIVLAVVTFSLSGCGKEGQNDLIPDPIEDLFCWQCTLTMKVQSSLGTQSDTQKFEECEKTVKQIREIEADNTYVKNVDGATLTVKTKCVKK